jgi:hypothetical protein
MWFEPGELSQAKTNTLANSANPANYEPEYTKTAPLISKLAELAAPFDSEIDNGFLSTVDQQKILHWLGHIREEDQETIAETLNRCRSDAETLAYFLHRAEESGISQKPESQTTTCRNCQSFKSYNSHGGGAGRCLIGIQLTGVCGWADTAHQCDKYQEHTKAH